MAFAHSRSRRLAGVVFLAAAVILLVAGQTFLRTRLTGLVFGVYWLLCLLLVALAMGTALLDLLIIRHQARRQHLDLIRQTLAEDRPKATPTPPPPTGTVASAKKHQNRPAKH